MGTAVPDPHVLVPDTNVSEGMVIDGWHGDAPGVEVSKPVLVSFRTMGCLFPLRTA